MKQEIKTYAKIVLVVGLSISLAVIRRETWVLEPSPEPSIAFLLSVAFILIGGTAFLFLLLESSVSKNDDSLDQ